MADNNGHNEDNQKVKQCPFLKELCIGEGCALYGELARNTGGLLQKFGACSFNAVVLILSEINQKTQVQQSKIQLPKELFES